MFVDRSPSGPELCRSPIIAALFLAVLSAAFVIVSKKFLSQDSGGSVIWFADAIAIAFLYRHEARHWPLLISVFLLANIAAGVALNFEMKLALQHTLAGITEVLLAAVLLRHFCPQDSYFDSLQQWARFTFFSAVLPPLASAGIGSAVVVAAGHAVYWEVFPAWYIADAVGILILLPVALMCRWDSLSSLVRGAELGRFLLVGGIALGSILLLLLLTSHPFVFFALPLIWSATRLPLFQTMLVIFLAMLTLVLCYTGLDIHVQQHLPTAGSELADSGIVLSIFASAIPAYVMAVSTNIERNRNARIVEMESSFRAAVEQSHIGMLLVSLDGHILQANHSFCEFLGYREDELVGHSVLDITFLDDLTEKGSLVDTLFFGAGEAQQMEKRYVRKDGRMVWGYLSACLARGINGEPLYSVAQVEDIDWRKRSEEKLAESEERWKFSLISSDQGVYDWNLKSSEVFYSDWLRRSLGITRDGMGSREDWFARVHSDDLPGLRQQQEQHLCGERDSINCEYRVRADNGKYRWVNECARVMDRGVEGNAQRLIGIFRDITCTKKLAQSLAEEKERLQVTLSAIADAVVATDLYQRINFMNPVAEQMTGVRLEQVRGQQLDMVFHITLGPDGEVLANPVAQCLASGKHVFGSEGAVLHNRDKRSYDIKSSASPLKTDHGELIGAVMVLQDVSETRQLIHQLSYKASHDDLTGLPNRDAFKHELLKATESVRDGDEQHSLAYIDLDRFKVINDSAGHQAGDALLKKVSRQLRSLLRASDSVARLGGDEFGLLLRHCNKEQAKLRCEQLIRQIAGLRFSWKTRVYDVGASIGITEINRNNDRLGDLLSQADVACYSAKHTSRGTVMLYEMDQSTAAEQHREIIMASAIREALDENRLTLCVQPIAYTADTGVVNHYEVLVRMVDDYGNLIMPGAFIPAAERYGLMLQIDRWVADEVLVRRAAQIARSGLSFSLNVSAEAIGDTEFQQHLLKVLKLTPIPIHCIGFEITETAMINQMDSASQFVASLRKLGCKVALDDFGNGLSSFSYLKAFSIDFIKIDGSFVRQVESNFVDLIIVESIHQVAHRLGAQTIAEYVEDAATAECLHSIGVDLVQGYHIGRPQALEELLPRGAVTGMAGEMVSG